MLWDVMTFFDDPGEAERYAQSRPYFHQLAIERAARAIGLEGKVPVTLDIACGTGLSSRALTSIAERVVGLDISWYMISRAGSHEQVRYALSMAEALPIRGGSIPLISCALAFHWFERELFLQNCRRVLEPGGWLMIYNNGFTGRMKENSDFSTWSGKTYPDRFPTPARNSEPITREVAAAAGFELNGEEAYENEVVFTPEALADYLCTQTNVAAAIREGHETAESARAWVLAGIRPYFPGAEGTFIFNTRAWYLRKIEEG